MWISRHFDGHVFYFLLLNFTTSFWNSRRFWRLPQSEYGYFWTFVGICGNLFTNVVVVFMVFFVRFIITKYLFNMDLCWNCVFIVSNTEKYIRVLSYSAIQMNVESFEYLLIPYALFSCIFPFIRAQQIARSRVGVKNFHSLTGVFKRSTHAQLLHRSQCISDLTHTHEQF